LEDKPDPILKPSSSKGEKLEPSFVENDLRLLRSDDLMSTYNNLKSEDLILDITPYL
jgi:hypothetical protein